MSKLQLKATGMELTDAIRDYAEKRVSALDKFLSRYKDQPFVYMEVGKTTAHHKSGDVYMAELTISGIGSDVRMVSYKDDLYSAIDDVKEEAMVALASMKDRKDTLFRRGARSVKKMLKGISKRNPFTSK